MDQKHKMIKETVKLATAEIIKAVEEDTDRRLSQKAADAIENYVTSSILTIQLAQLITAISEDSATSIGLN